MSHDLRKRVNWRAQAGTRYVSLKRKLSIFFKIVTSKNDSDWSILGS
jgi:hypothetical protein